MITQKNPIGRYAVEINSTATAAESPIHNPKFAPPVTSYSLPATAAAPQSIIHNPKSNIQNPIHPANPVKLTRFRSPYGLLPAVFLRYASILSKIHPKSKIHHPKFSYPPIPSVAVFATTPGSRFVEMILPLFKIQHHRFRRPRRLLQQRQAGENHFVEVTDMVEREAQRSKKPLMMLRYDCYFIAGMNAQFAESRKLETTVCSNLERLGYAH